MCGIFCYLGTNFQFGKRILEKLNDIFQRRGPDHHDKIEQQLDHFHLILASWVLHMRGTQMISQPIVSEAGNILIFNGEVFGGLEIGNNNDTKILLARLDVCSSEESIGKVIETIQGPWSFVFYQKLQRKVWFGRDYFGRRSLLFCNTSNGFIISSVAKRPDKLSLSWAEIPAGVFCINLDELCKTSDIFKSLSIFSWTSITSGKPKEISFGHDFTPTFGRNLSFPVRLKFPRNDSVEISDADINYIVSNQHAPLEQLCQACDLKNLWPVCRELIDKLSKAVECRTNSLVSWKSCCKVGILFSGGIDCTMLALLAHLFVPRDEPIDLLNVAFEQCKIKNKQQPVKNNDYSVPDRITGLSSYTELCKLCPGRKWNFVEINISIEELQKQRAARVADLTYPKETVLDDSIACALWFASKGEGVISSPDGSTTAYKSGARILLCGMGADEQLGGYSRHRGVYERNRDWAEVEDEINMEIERIAIRNLGRDDRIVSDHGREARFPYLDEELVSFLRSIPVHQKADFRCIRGVGEKILLRGAGYLLGLREATVLPKRAIQFGSRIAKAEMRKEKGGDVCKRLQIGT